MNDFAMKVLSANLGQTYLFSVGQAGYIIKSKSGSLLGIDLYLSDCVERIEGHIGFKRLLPKILQPYEIEFDTIIATHPHFDHFDFDSIPELISNGKTQLFASTNCAQEIKNLKMQDTNITYVKEGDKYSCKEFEIEFVRCDHGINTPDAVGAIVCVDGKKLYFTGDTCLRLDWIEYFKEKGPFDIMIAPINGAYGNLNENECALLSEYLKPKITIPCHYGMFATHGGSLKKFMEVFNKENTYIILTQGEKIIC